MWLSNFRGWEEREVNGEYYVFDARDILQVIDRDEVNLSTFIENNPNTDSESYTYEMTWSQDDFIRVAQAFHDFQYGDQAKDWDIYSIDFVAWCENALVDQAGNLIQMRITHGSISYYKTVVGIDNVPYLETSKILLFPNLNHLWLVLGYYNPVPYSRYVKLPEWDSMNFEEMKIKGEDAMLITVNDRGLDKNCHIAVTNSLDDDYYGWDVYFTNIGIDYDFIIDDQTGTVEIIEKKW